MLNFLTSYIPIKIEPCLKFSRCLFIASIGNPGKSYEYTRHNTGHIFVDQLINKYWKDHLKKSSIKDVYSSTKYPNLILFKSDKTYMNLQGKPIFSKLKQFDKNSELLIIHDEIQLKLGKYQVRDKKTSARGHNGLKSIDGYLKNRYRKLSIGIGKSESMSVIDYVLTKFDVKELEILSEEVFPKCVEELETMLEDDLIEDEGKHESYSI